MGLVSRRPPGCSVRALRAPASRFVALGEAVWRRSVRVVTHSRLFFGAMADHGVTPADRTDDGDPVAALFGAPTSAEDDAHRTGPFAGIDDDDTVTLDGIFAGRSSDTEEPSRGRRRHRATRHSPRAAGRRAHARPRAPQLKIGVPQVTGALRLRIVCVVGILVAGLLFVHLVLSARHGGTPVKTRAAAVTPTGPTVMPDARGELLTARRVVQQAQRRTAARRAAAVRAATRQRADHRRAATLRAARRRAAQARARRATPPPPPPAPRPTTAGTTTSHSNPTTRPRAPAPPSASGGTQGSCTPGDLGC